MRTYRVELDSAGKAVSCAIAPTDCPAGNSVYYVRAANLKEAAKKAYNLYHSQRLAARREKYAAEGRCKCGRDRSAEVPSDRSFSTCPKCRAMSIPQHQRAYARRRGEVVEPLKSKAEHFQDRRAEEKLELLTRVQRAYERLTMSQFGAWLRAEIAAFGGVSDRTTG